MRPKIPKSHWPRATVPWAGIIFPARPRARDAWRQRAASREGTRPMVTPIEGTNSLASSSPAKSSFSLPLLWRLNVSLAGGRETAAAHKAKKPSGAFLGWEGKSAIKCECTKNRERCLQLPWARCLLCSPGPMLLLLTRGEDPNKKLHNCRRGWVLYYSCTTTLLYNKPFGRVFGGEHDRPQEPTQLALGVLFACRPLLSVVFKIGASPYNGKWTCRSWSYARAQRAALLIYLCESMMEHISPTNVVLALVRSNISC